MRAILALPLLLIGASALAENRIDLIRPDAPELADFGALAIGVTTLNLVNPGQIDIASATETEAPLYDRPLTVEVWYPAAEGMPPGCRCMIALLRSRFGIRQPRECPPAAPTPRCCATV